MEELLVGKGRVGRVVISPRNNLAAAMPCPALFEAVESNS